jgi:hypothetical protein
MNIQTVAENLRNTIAGKEAYLARENENRQSEDAHVRMVAYTVVKMLEINIAELNRILDDVVECSITGIELSWRDNPDRSGGQFTQEEIDNAGRWQ